MAEYVLDASALLALLTDEPGADRVIAALNAGALLSTVNLAEVVGKLANSVLSDEQIREALADLGFTVVDFDEETAYLAGWLSTETRALGLSLGDRACLGLAIGVGLTALTADRAWLNLPFSVAVECIR